MKITEKDSVKRFTCDTGEELISAFKTIVDEKQYGYINGLRVDLFSASAVISVHNLINEENKIKWTGLATRTMQNDKLSEPKKFAAIRMIDMAFKLIK